jgi:predicted RNA binding protein YcfA (HicA-like mRNA interferase family)
MAGTLYRDLVDLLEAAGCHFHRQGKGSHEIWHSPKTGYFSVPANISSRRLANQILKEAGLPKAF